MVFDLENKTKLLTDKNKLLYTEVVTLRKELEHKSNDLEKI